MAAIADAQLALRLRLGDGGEVAWQENVGVGAQLLQLGVIGVIPQRLPVESVVRCDGCEALTLLYFMQWVIAIPPRTIDAIFQYRGRALRELPSILGRSNPNRELNGHPS